MTTLDEICPICGEGHLREYVGSNRFEYKDQTTELKMQFSTCDSCGCEQANEAQMRANKRTTIAFKKEVNGLLTGAEVRSLREHFGITQVEAAKIFGGGPVAFSKYESDDLAQSKARDNLLRLAYEEPRVFTNLAKKAGVHTPHTGLAKGMPIASDELFAGEWISIGSELPQSQPLSTRVFYFSESVVDSEWTDLELPENMLKKSA